MTDEEIGRSVRDLSRWNVVVAVCIALPSILLMRDDRDFLIGIVLLVQGLALFQFRKFKVCAWYWAAAAFLVAAAVTCILVVIPPFDHEGPSSGLGALAGFPAYIGSMWLLWRLARRFG